MCQKAIKATLGTSVTLLEDVEIEPSKFYTLHRVGKDSVMSYDTMQGFKCPISSPILVYVNVGKGGGDVNLSWVILKKDENFKKLLIWE